MMMLLAAFAMVAVLLAAIGVYGVLAYVVSQRTQEIGLRLAIGAAPDDVVRLFLREGLTLTLVGLFAGLAGALAAGRVLTTLLFGVTATDPITFVAVAGALGLAALCASYLPARRAATVESDDCAACGLTKSEVGSRKSDGRVESVNGEAVRRRDVIVIGVAACNRTPENAGPPAKPNILLVTIDTLRADGSLPASHPHLIGSRPRLCSSRRRARRCRSRCHPTRRS